MSTSEAAPAAVRRQAVVIAVCAVTVLVVGLIVGRARSGDRRTPAATLAAPVEMPALTLTDTDGQPFDLRSRAAGRVTLLYLGYVNCPDVCPITTSVLGETLATMPADVRAAVQVVFVTVDPARDSPAQIRAFLDQFDPTFVGLSAAPDDLERLQAALNAPGAVAEPPSDGSYTVGHTTAVYVFEPDGIARRAYPFGTRQSEWAAVLPEVVAT